MQPAYHPLVQQAREYLPAADQATFTFGFYPPTNREELYGRNGRFSVQFLTGGVLVEVFPQSAAGEVMVFATWPEEDGDSSLLFSGQYLVLQGHTPDWPDGLFDQHRQQVKILLGMIRMQA